jgi:hypothetical protein
MLYEFINFMDMNHYESEKLLNKPSGAPSQTTTSAAASGSLGSELDSANILRMDSAVDFCVKNR